MLILLFPLCAYAQTGKECQAIMQKADAAILRQDYTLALTKLRAYKVCDPSKVTQADDKIAYVFNKIKEQRDRAGIARDEAVKQTGIARVQKARAEAAQKNAERQTHLAQLSAMTANVSLLSNDNPTLAFRLSCLAYESNPSLENAEILNRIVSDTTNVMFHSKINNFLMSFVYDDRRSILYGSNSMYIFEYDANGNQIRAFPLPGSPVSTASCSAYTVALKQNSISLYRHADYAEKEIARPAQGSTAVRWSRDGAYILLSGGSEIHILDTLLNEVYKLSTGFMITFDVSPGMNAVAVSNGSEVLLYDPAEPLSIDTIPEPNVNCLAFSGDGRKLYTSKGIDKKIKIWDSGSEEPFVFEGHTGRVLSMNLRAVPAEKDTILSISDDGASILWTEEGQIIRSLKNKADRTIEAVLSTEGKRAVTKTEKGLNTWEFQRNPFGIVSTLYPNRNVTDYIKGMVVLPGDSNVFSIITPDTLRRLSLPPPDALFDVSIIDGKDLFLLMGTNDISLLNIKTGERKILLDGEYRWANTLINTNGKILCWKDSTLFYFNKVGALIKKEKFPYFIQNIGMPPGKDEVLEIYYDEARLTNILTGEIKGKWRKDNLRGLYLKGLQYSPSGDYIVGWTSRNAFLFDTAWHQLRTYEHGNITRVKFSETGDSLYFLGMGVETRYTLEGLKRSKDIYDLTIADKIRYNVPGFIKEIVARGDWTEFEACVSYFTTDYFTSVNEANIEQLNYLESQSHRFFRKSSSYYYMLDTRISYINSYIQFTETHNFKSLKKVLQKIAGNLTKEKKMLSTHYGKK
ncbi:WD40 repeat domain-containing protein [Chitinophaga niabensis]|uniref:WD40 repeat domain-containing protein n=1 Tax=Chitinophaga niabensis TaxID=536979 RepID=UPI001F36991D|nr:WD40 repeat domain-containing protein [Chitinophaga niabensis]